MFQKNHNRVDVAVAEPIRRQSAAERNHVATTRNLVVITSRTVMDTRFWGPSAWKLLHLAAEVCQQGDCEEYNRTTIPLFFETLPYVLPCKFCRYSLTDYYREHPLKTVDGKIVKGSNLQRWVYTIHNCVNDKLRDQGLHPAPNPPYTKVKQFYKTLAKQPWQQKMSYIWDFLFSVAYHHPKEKQLYEKPMPECPSHVRRCKDTDEKNKWNVLPLLDRLVWFYKFWIYLPDVMPHEMRVEWLRARRATSDTWDGNHPPRVLHSRESMMEWLWRMRCELEKGYHDPYTSICKKIASYSSDCSTQKGVFTCRKKRHGAKKTKKHTRS